MKHVAMDEFKLSQKGFGRAVFGLMALSPVAAVLIPWDFGSLDNDYRQLMAGHSLSIIMIELLIFIALFKNENLISDFVKQTNWPDKIVGTVFLSAVLYSMLFVSVSKMLFVLGTLVLLIHFLFTISFFKNMNHVDRHTQQYFWVFLGTSVIIYTALWATDFLIFPPIESDWIERVPGVTNVRWTGFFWLSSFAAGLALARSSGLKHFLPAVLFGAFGLTMTLWTGTRGSLVAMAFGALCAAILSATYRKFIIKYCLASAVVAVVINFYAPIPHKQYGMDRILSRIQPSEVIDRGGSGRTALWKWTAKLAQNHPFVGHGIDQFQKMGPKQTLGFKGPHSFSMQMLFSVGILGILTFLYGTWRFVGLYRLEVRSPHQVAAATFFSGGCIYAGYDNFGYYPYPVAIFTLSMFMLFKSRRPLGPSST